MCAGNCVKTFIRNHQPFHWFTSQNVGRDNFIYIAGAHASVPDRFGINNNSGSVFTLVQATGVIGADISFEPFFGELLLEQDLQFFLGCGVTAAAWVSGRALVPTHENMLFKLRHRNTVMDFCAKVLRLVFELDHRMVAAAEGGNMVQAVLNIRHGDDRPEAINSMSAFS